MENALLAQTFGPFPGESMGSYRLLGWTVWLGDAVWNKGSGGPGGVWFKKFAGCHAGNVDRTRTFMYSKTPTFALSPGFTPENGKHPHTEDGRVTRGSETSTQTLKIKKETCVIPHKKVMARPVPKVYYKGS